VNNKDKDLALRFQCGNNQSLIPSQIIGSTRYSKQNLPAYPSTKSGTNASPMQTSSALWSHFRLNNEIYLTMGLTDFLSHTKVSDALTALGRLLLWWRCIFQTNISTSGIYIWAGPRSTFLTRANTFHLELCHAPQSRTVHNSNQEYVSKGRCIATLDTGCTQRKSTTQSPFDVLYSFHPRLVSSIRNPFTIPPSIQAQPSI
jgi:hypothetical protein